MSEHNFSTSDHQAQIDIGISRVVAANGDSGPYDMSNKENLIANDFDDEPMDIDSSMNAPGTPRGAQQLMNDPNSVKLNRQVHLMNGNAVNGSGAKIVKPIKAGTPMNTKVIRPQSHSAYNGDLDEFANIDPFKTRSKMVNDSTESLYQTPQLELRPLSTSSSPKSQQIASNDEHKQTEFNDEWETHKKKHNSKANSPISVNIINNGTLHQHPHENHQQNQQNSPIQTNTASSSAVSSSTDLSTASSSSISPPEQNFQCNINTNDPFLTPQRNFTSTITATSETTTATIGNLIDTSENLIFNPSTCNQNVNARSSSENTASFTPDSVIFDSIFSNDGEFQSFLDLLEKKETDNSIKNSPKFSEFARKSLYLQFDPIIQSRTLSPEKIKRLSLIRDKQEAIKFFLSGIAEENEQQTGANKTLVEIDEFTPIQEQDEQEQQEHSDSNKATVLVDTTITSTEIVYKSDSNTNANENSKLIVNMESTNLITTVNESNTEQNGTDYESEQTEIGTNRNNDDYALNTKTYTRRSNVGRINSSDAYANNNNKLHSISSESAEHGADQSFGGDSERVSDSNLNQMCNSFDEKIKINTSHHLNGHASDASNKKLLDFSPTHSTVTSVTAISDDDATTSSIISSRADVTMAASVAANQTKLMNELNAMKEKEKALLSRIKVLEDDNEKFNVVATEFERIIQSLIKEKEESESKLKEEIIELTKERDHLQEDVIGVERAFDDLHRRFEKLKTKVEEFKKNEETLQQAVEGYKQQLEKEKMKYTTLKKHAEEKLDMANSEIEKLRKSTSIELQTVKAELKRAEIKINSLELNLQQKDNENQQLTNLLEDLLSKVKPSG